MVAALGIRLQPYLTAVVVLGVGMAALAGALFAPIALVHPAMGAEIITSAFVVVVIGGLGSFWGVVIAAAIVGVAKGLVTGAGWPRASRRRASAPARRSP